MNELEVKTVNDLKAYVNKLREFKTYCTAGAILICTQKISEDLDEKLNKTRNLYNYAEGHAQKVIHRYDDALRSCKDARHYIGDSDLECKCELQEAEMLLVQIRHQINTLRTELENACQHTKNFCLQVHNMTDRCIKTMETNIANIENYSKEHH